MIEHCLFIDEQKLFDLLMDCAQITQPPVDPEPWELLMWCSQSAGRIHLGAIVLAEKLRKGLLWI